MLAKKCGRERTQNGSRLRLKLGKCKNLRIGTEFSKAITLFSKWIHVAWFFFIELSMSFLCRFINS